VVAGCVEVSFSCSMICSTSAILSSVLEVRASNACRCAATLAGVVAAFVFEVVGGLGSSMFALSSYVVTRATRSSTSLSRCSILACCSLLISYWSKMSTCNYVILSSMPRYLDLSSLVLSSCSNLTRTADSPRILTFSSRLLPAVWTVLMESSASFFHASS
jgi:hypothetical protein